MPMNREACSTRSSAGSRPDRHGPAPSGTRDGTGTGLLPPPCGQPAAPGVAVAGTLGRRLVDGARRVRILGDDITVRASIHTIGGLSAHADQDGLLRWLSAIRRPPSRVFVVHGEAQTALGFADLLAERFGWHAEAPPAGTCVHL